MFGYIIANKPELKIKEYDVYRSYYCGLCKALGKNGGQIARLALSYDMTFVYMVLSSLYEPEKSVRNEKCILHPVTKNMVTVNRISEYTADMSVLMTYLKGRDDWKDMENMKKSVAGRMTVDITGKSCERIRKKYPKKVSFILSRMKKLDIGEKENNQDIDYMAGLFGDIMGEIFSMESDVWEAALRKMGFYMGKFIYLMDAYEDVEKDIKTGNYNPFAVSYKHMKNDEFESYTENILIMMMAECTGAFERLPILENAEIMRNILYSGVWIKYRKVSEDRRNIRDKRNRKIKEKRENNDESV